MLTVIFAVRQTGILTALPLLVMPGAIPGHFLVPLPMQRKLRTMTTVDKLMEIISEDLQGLCLGFDMLSCRHHVWEPVRNLLEDSQY